jgi:hypothetical protein
VESHAARVFRFGNGKAKLCIKMAFDLPVAFLVSTSSKVVDKETRWGLLKLSNVLETLFLLGQCTSVPDLSITATNSHACGDAQEVWPGVD